MGRQKMSSLISNIPRIKDYFSLNIGLLTDIGTVGIENAVILIRVKSKSDGEKQC